MFHSQYLRCPGCKKIVFDEDLALANISNPTPCCGHSGESRQVWPSVPAQRFLGLVSNQDLADDDEMRVAVILLCTAIELLLEYVVWDLLSIHNTPTEVAEFILDSNWVQLLSAPDRSIWDNPMCAIKIAHGLHG